MKREIAKGISKTEWVCGATLAVDCRHFPDNRLKCYVCWWRMAKSRGNAIIGWACATLGSSSMDFPTGYRWCEGELPLLCFRSLPFLIFPISEQTAASNLRQMVLAILLHSRFPCHQNALVSCRVNNILIVIVPRYYSRSTTCFFFCQFAYSTTLRSFCALCTLGSLFLALVLAGRIKMNINHN